jgi:ubiquinone/menaquinone biosynthesis C-methylase UbiE
MWLTEQILYQLAKLLYKGEVAQSSEMKRAVKDITEYTSYRISKLPQIIEAARRYGIDLQGKVALDLGCGDGVMSMEYLKYGADRVIGVDIDAKAVAQAQEQNDNPDAEFLVSDVSTMPLPDNYVDVIISYDAFEHIATPSVILAECRRVLRPGGQMLIGTWGWYHPFAPHLWATMPVPWAHVFFSEKTMLRACRKVYHSAWYVPNMSDFDESGRKKERKYDRESISTDYLNKFLIRDFERVFEESGLDFRVYLQPFRSKYARWTSCFLRVPWVREFIAGYLWAVLVKPDGNAAHGNLSHEMQHAAD